MSTATPVIGFVGDAGSGKTTLAAQITRYFNNHGKKVKVLIGGTVNDEERPSLNERFSVAGAADVEISNNYADAMLRSRDVDIVVTDGFDGVPHPKVFVFRTEDQAGYVADVLQPIIAAVTTQSFEKENNAGIPVFYFHELDDFFEFLIGKLGITI